MFKLLIVDDEQRIREVIKTYAEFEGHEVMEAKDGLEAIQLCKENDFDVIVMDIMMPHLDGFSAYKEIKKTKDIPVLMLSARDEEYDKLFGFEIGIDDYVVKPFSPKELLARLNVIVSRHQKLRPSHELKFEGLEIDQDGREVYVDHNRIELTPKEYEILLFLAKNDGIALSREKLLNQIWGYDFYGDDRTVDTHIKMLRNSLGEYRKFIVTVRGVGYKFDTRVQDQEERA
ncbi:MAG: response regulator transcription factor [Peptoniphilus sp. oral taxon 375]|uniref:response regulator transcription factor n=1 Tax=Urinicoccus timonensis TaxID=2024205 RepID=UPI00021A22CC|nr:response regulator transcription factor [Urinicoccus timonensis]EGS31471.1 response regulator receiver domain protein [Peptoniphilus sp. oral taxon 375 str. F0436]MBS4871421.1 response regulator transcription factor [Peptoniphilus sp. oral taxon 375]